MNGGPYINGCSMGYQRINEIVECYTFLCDWANGGLLPVSHVAKMANVSWVLAKKLMIEVDGGIRDSRAGWLLNKCSNVAK